MAECMNKIHKAAYHCYPTALKGCSGIVFTPGFWICGWVGRQREKVCPGCISETVRCRKLILGRDLDLTFDLAAVTLSLKILSEPYLVNNSVGS